MRAVFLSKALLKQILKLAYSAGMITDEALWLDALQARNNVAHSYNELIALEIVRGAKARYYDMFCALRAEIEKNWLAYRSLPPT